MNMLLGEPEKCRGGRRIFHPMEGGWGQANERHLWQVHEGHIGRNIIAFNIYINYQKGQLSATRRGDMAPLAPDGPSAPEGVQWPVGK